MSRKVAFVACGLLAGVALCAQAQEAPAPRTKVSAEACEQAVLAKYPGKVVKVELKRERGRKVFEFDVEGAKTWDVECDASSGKITEVEEEVTADHERFKNAKVGLEAAKAKALKRFPGEVVETEFELEANGKASYEFDIRTKKGGEVKVEVDADTGRIVEHSKEVWQRGQE